MPFCFISKLPTPKIESIFPIFRCKVYLLWNVGSRKKMRKEASEREKRKISSFDSISMALNCCRDFVKSQFSSPNAFSPSPHTLTRSPPRSCKIWRGARGYMFIQKALICILLILPFKSCRKWIVDSNVTLTILCGKLHYETINVAKKFWL